MLRVVNKQAELWPRGAGECGHHVDTLRHHPHEDAREAAMGTRVPAHLAGHTKAPPSER